MAEIKFLVMDVDGTLTDGMVYMGNSGEAFKAFNIKDGCGIKEILPEKKIIPVIITARESGSLLERCRELNIKEIHQGCRNKLGKLKEILDKYSKADRYGFENVAYVGDDLLDIPCMTEIQKYGGLVTCPKDAIDEIKSIADYVSKCKSGRGAVRDIINYLIKDNKRMELTYYNERVNFAIEYLESLDLDSMEVGEYKVNGFFHFIIKEYPAQREEACEFESHRKYVDIQWVLRGTEKICLRNERRTFENCVYDKQNERPAFSNSNINTEVVLKQNSYVVIPEHVVYKPCIRYRKMEVIKKLIGRVRID